MLRVLCSRSELEENGEVIAVGDNVSRLASYGEHVYYGTELDALEWHFDQYADAFGDPATTISGQVTAISAVFVRLTRATDGWTARLGSAQLEPLTTTSATRTIEDTIDWGPVSPPDPDGHSYSVGYPQIREGDELHAGWVITLASPTFTAHAPSVTLS